jgi:hypothetical protein
VPAYETFNFTTPGENSTSGHTALAGEIARVRCTSVIGTVNVYLTIQRNAVTTRINIDDLEAWATAIIAQGDVVGLIADIGVNTTCAGILELVP